MEDKKLPRKELIHDLSLSKGNNSTMAKPLIFTVIIMLILGIGTGYIASNLSGSASKGPLSINENEKSGEIKKRIYNRR